MTSQYGILVLILVIYVFVLKIPGVVFLRAL